MIASRTILSIIAGSLICNAFPQGQNASSTSANSTTVGLVAGLNTMVVNGTATQSATTTYSGVSTTVTLSSVSGSQTVQPSAAAVSQISDGQVQAPTAMPVSQISEGQVQAPTASAVPVSQISDGQVQAPTNTVVPVSQISDGQVQAPTASVMPVSQISDGQVQAPTGAPVSQISDGQVQAPTGAPVSQISDGQVQAPTGSPVSQISDGQVQAPSATASGNSSVPATMASACAYEGVLEVVIDNQGDMYDQQGRIAYIADNYQLQFDFQPQDTALTAGPFTLIDSYLALNGNAQFFACLSGSFYNIYNQSIGGQCVPMVLTGVTLVDCSSS